MWENGRTIEIPWLCMGDFNDILYEYENEGGKMRAAKKIKGFRQMVENCKLIDLQFKGQKFTWINRREEGMIKERIDKGLVNLAWLEQYPRTQVINLPIIGSDHRPIYIDSDYCEGRAPKQFKFEIIWTEKEECGQVIREGW